MAREVVLDGDISLNLHTDGELTLDLQSDGECGVVTRVTEYSAPVYTGATTVTPSAETQILQTANRTVTENITINPIPSNYGLITWDGTVLTVS